MNFNEAYEYVIKSYSAGKKRGYDLIRAALDLAGSPYKTLPVIQVAGTNGKGSVCSMLNSILLSAGYSTGLFTSPHLIKFNERFKVNGNDLTDDEMAKYAAQAKALSEAVLGAGEFFSFFEMFTICAFLCFADKKVDLAIFEAGVGGRLDSTNIAENTVLSVITSISFDHTDLLGGTIREITLEKAGIIKKNTKTVLYFQSEEVYNLIKGVCAEKGSELYYPSKLKIETRNESLSGAEFDITCEYFRYENVRLNFAGEYQLQNAATALLAVSALRASGYSVTESAVYAGMKAARWAGRMETLSENPLILLEGAHNLGGIYELDRSINRYFAGKDVILVFAALKGKDYRGMVSLITANANVKTVIFTTPAYRVKAADPNELALSCEKTKEIFIIEGYKDALNKAVSLAKENGVIICCGSLYLVGDISESFSGGHK
ncbi:bifunctional folylpolyglutamate synthase/dihydrofolate synthase [Clostridia bacterium]|nr:bifunctional folylpolyglutamate synthase/dihydrofolate synthase [Clostridia bacterium]